MRICIVYDCLFPYTVGGAERWYRNLSERLAADGHEVTYLTSRQWDRGVDPALAGVDVRAVAPRTALYTRRGRRRVLPPIVFGLGVLLHLLFRRRRYDVVHTASFPYFSVLAAAAARRLGRYGLVVDWHEVWTRDYWREYFGRGAGDVGWLVQVLCARVAQRAFCFSRLQGLRLRDEGLRGEVTILPGEYYGPLEPRFEADVEQLVVFAGRHIPEKQAAAIPAAIARAREQLPELRAAILGDGPERPRVEQLVRELGQDKFVRVTGFVATEVVDETLARAMCMLLPSRREGYGLIVLEAAARSTPSIVVAGTDNAAVELISEGENGYVAASASAEDLAAAIVRTHDAGEGLRESTRDWFARNGPRMSLSHSLAIVLQVYGHAQSEDRPGVTLRSGR
jgi:glycosyltransferase involved in cell wall biosynthesis